MIPDEERCLLSRSDSDLSELKASSSEKAFNVNSVAGVILASTGLLPLIRKVARNYSTDNQQEFSFQESISLSSQPPMLILLLL